MELRNLTRYFVINKALRLHHSKTGERVSLMQLHVLISIGYLGRTGTKAILSYLKGFNRSMSPNQLQDILRVLVDIGIVERVNGVYCLNVSGKLLLHAIEERCRDTRLDR